MIIKNKLLSSKEIVNLLLNKYKSLEINQLHQKAYEEIVKLKENYYENKVDEFLEKLDIPESIRKMLKDKMLSPVEINGKIYSNFLEETVRRITQAIQPISGNIAELCAKIELEKNNLKEGVHFKCKIKGTDLVIYHPDIKSPKKVHRVEIKNVSVRERATRSLSFDGDSLLGFFNNPKEFTEEGVKIIDELCLKTSGYCYLPPKTLSEIKYKTNRFRKNTKFGKDIAYFVKTGKLP